MKCIYCEKEEICTELGIKIYRNFVAAIKRNGGIYIPQERLLQSNGMWFLESKHYTTRVYHCPICGRKLEVNK